MVYNKRKCDRMKTIVIGDIHGCYNELKTLIEDLTTKHIYNKKKDRLIFLGDYIDRGDDSRLVVNYIRDIQKGNPNVIALKGNHEDMLLNYYDGDKYSEWLYNGYEYTLKSYKNHNSEFESDIQWMRNLPLYYEDEDFVYVHAGIDKRQSMDKQRHDTLLWAREEFIYDTTPYNKRVIFGHTPKYSKPYYTYGSDICIDSGCVFGGALTALIIEDGEEKEIYQVNKTKKGEQNEGI